MWREIAPDMVSNLHDLADCLLKQTVDYKLVVSLDSAWLYSNDLTLIDNVVALPYVQHVAFSQAVVDRPRDTIRLKHPKHQYRSYFRAQKLTSQQKITLQQFLNNQIDHVRSSPALVKWLDCPFNHLQEYFFVDHDSQTWLTMLALVHTGLIRKTMQIIPAK